MVQVLEEKWVKTRKPHKCFGCQYKFPSGTRMHTSTCVADYIYTLYFCKTCEKHYPKECCYYDCYDDGIQAYEHGPFECAEWFAIAIENNHPMGDTQHEQS